MPSPLEQSRPAEAKRRRPAVAEPRLSFILLSVRVSMPGRSLPDWKVTINAQNRLTDVLRRWAGLHLGHICEEGSLPEGIKAFAGSGGEPLDVGRRLEVLRPRLPVASGRLVVLITLPAPPEAIGDGAEKRRLGGAAGGGQGKLSKLRISTRYADVDGDSSGFHRSSTFQAKLEAGVYQQGVFTQTHYIEAMRSPPELANSEVTLDSRELFVFPEQGFDPVRHSAPGSATGAATPPLFQVVLRGPRERIAGWEAMCDGLRHLGLAPGRLDVPFPVFIPSRGRPRGANLNWEAQHVFGRGLCSAAGALSPVVCVVVEPQEEAAYREVWPTALTMALPRSDRGPGYVRWVIQKVCAKAYQWCPEAARGNRWQARCLPYVWICDDGLSMFYSLQALGPQAEFTFISDKAGAQRVKARRAPEGTPMFREAFMAVQRHTFLPRAAVAGFLRDDGTAVCKKSDWKSDELSLCKIVLLNLAELRRLEVEYQQCLKMYEDICLTFQVLRAGGHTLKCQGFCYWAAHRAHGGCAEQRRRRGETGTQIEDLMAPAAFKRLPGTEQSAIRELFDWVRSKEQLSIAKSGK